MPPAPRAYVTVARIVRARGHRGEVAAEVLTDFPERLTRLREAWLAKPAAGSGPAAEGRRVAVQRCWLSPSRGGQAIFHFEGCESIPEARALVGLEVQVPISQRVALPAGRHYISDLIGCTVWERPHAAGIAAAGATDVLLGTVRDVQMTGGTPLLVVDTPSGELLIPLAAEICVHIDVVAQRIEVVLPDGLRDLNP